MGSLEDDDESYVVMFALYDRTRTMIRTTIATCGVHCDTSPAGRFGDMARTLAARAARDGGKSCRRSLRATPYAAATFRCAPALCLANQVTAAYLSASGHTCTGAPGPLCPVLFRSVLSWPTLLCPARRSAQRTVMTSTQPSRFATR